LGIPVFQKTGRAAISNNKEQTFNRKLFPCLFFSLRVNATVDKRMSGYKVQAAFKEFFRAQSEPPSSVRNGFFGVQRGVFPVRFSI